jgi:hypothetical protein
MKRTIVTLICLFILCVSIANSLQILTLKPVLAAPDTNTNNLQILAASGPHLAILDGSSVSVPLEAFGSNSSYPLGLSPASIKAVYNLPSTGGNGTIAIIDAYDDPTIIADTGKFDDNFSLPGLNLLQVKFDVPLGQTISTNVNWTAEISLDVEWAHAIAPYAKIMLVEAYNEDYLLDAVNWARNQTVNPDVIAISMSWGMNETLMNPLDELRDDNYFKSSSGVSFFAASGDQGVIWWPAVSPNVVAVGGTTLNFFNGSLPPEIVWNDANGATGGGVSTVEIQPSYQESYGVQGSNGYRAVPDVSFDAGTAVSVYCSSPTEYGTNWLSLVGTSVGAPCWAGIYSLRPTASNPTLYMVAKSGYNSSSFRDITAGGNGYYNATVGYDFCTGLGSPLTGAFVGGQGDVDLDGTVDILDAITLENAFLANRTCPNWYALADINNDGTVNILDAILLANNWLRTYNTGTDVSGQRLSGGTMAAGGPSVLVDPSQITVFKGEDFNVNVNLTNVTDLQGWQFQLYWNNTVLNCTNAVIQTPAEWQNESQNFGLGLEENYNATNGLFDGAQSAQYPAPSFNGSMTIATFTFQALQPGTTPLTLTNILLGNSTAQPIACSVSSGSVSVYCGRYMRGGIQTINGLNAYKLNIPESTSSASVTQSGLEAGPRWGIRVFVRHSDGTETEVALDGQTGTPKAVVSGSGLQSANTSVSQTTLQSTDSLVVRVYVWLGADNGWSPCATFTTEQLQASTLQAATWMVFYSVHTTFNRLYGYSGTFYWGNTCNSRVQNLQYA